MKKRKINLSVKMLIGMLLGLIVGFAVGPSIAWVKPFGTIFVNLQNQYEQLKYLQKIICLLRSEIRYARSYLGEAFGRIGIKIFVFYCITSALAAVNGIFWATVIRPGIGFNAVTTGAVEREIPNIVDSLVVGTKCLMYSASFYEDEEEEGGRG